MSDPTLIGIITNIEGATAHVRLTQDAVSGLSFVRGKAYRVGQIGAFVRAPIGHIDLFGVVSQVGSSPDRSKEREDAPETRWITVQLLGESRRPRGFQRGISQYPSVGDRVYVVTDHDLAQIYGDSKDPGSITVGKIGNTESIPALVDVNKLISRHSAVLGATGSGKSTTVATILHQLASQEKFPGSRTIVFDLHGEYGRAFRESATVFRIGGDAAGEMHPLFVPYWALTLDELLKVTFGDVDDLSRAWLAEQITELKRETCAGFLGKNAVEPFSVDAPIPFSIHRLWFETHRALFSTHIVQQSGQSRESEAFLLDSAGQPVELGNPLNVIPPRYQPQRPGKIFLSGAAYNIRRQTQALAAKLRDSRYSFLFKPGPWTPKINGETDSDLDVWLEKMVGSSTPITVLDLSGVPSDILDDVIGGLIRAVYDALFWARYLPEGARERPLLLVLEEAHLYLGSGTSGQAKNTVRRVVKEGRKYGVSAMIVSQRPSEIDPTILSQCGTLIAMRLANNADRSHVRSSLPDHVDSLTATLPTLRTGEAIILGEAVRLPVRAEISLPPPRLRPESTDPLAYSNIGPGGWNHPIRSTDYRKVLTAWRTLSPREKEHIPHMERTQVTSSHIQSIGYDETTQTLEVEFTNGTIYQYYQVPRTEYDHMLILSTSGESVGTYFAANIRLIYTYIRC